MTNSEKKYIEKWKKKIEKEAFSGATTSINVPGPKSGIQKQQRDISINFQIIFFFFCIYTLLKGSLTFFLKRLVNLFSKKVSHIVMNIF